MITGPEQRRLAAIMFTDMVGYSALAQRDEKLALALLEEHRRLLRSLFPRFNGTEIKTIGDGFLVEFHSALEAVQCAIEIQRALAKRNHDVTATRRIEVKIGLHIGDVVHREGDVLGDGVNIASRIEPLAGAGGICISVDVERQIRSAIEISLVKLAPRELKNIQVPMDLFRIVLPWEKDREPGQTNSEPPSASSAVSPPRASGDDIGARPFWPATLLGTAALVLLAVSLAGWWFVHQSDQATKPVASSPSAAPAADQKSIAVLPFLNISGDPENEYFSDGITEEILNALARTPGLRVAARTSAFSFKGKNESVQRIGETLKVGVVLEGSVRRSGNQLRITAQLINAADGFHLWSETFDRQALDVFAIQTEVAQQVQGALKVKLLAGSSPNATLAGTDNLEAYDLYLRGRHFWNQRTGADAQRAVDFFQQAAEKDPKFAAAYAGLGSSYVLLPEYAAVPVREAIPKARAAARRALELDGRLAEAHAVLGMCAQCDWDLVAAEQEYREALRLNPNHATSYHWYSLLALVRGNTEEGLAEIRNAQALDPLSAVIQETLACHLIQAGRYDEALAEFDKCLQLSSDFLSTYVDRGRVFLVQGRILDAIAGFEQGRKKTGDTPFALGYLGHAYARAGRTNEARQILETLKTASASGAAASVEIALVYLGLRDLDQAFVWLERAVAGRDADPRSWRIDPLYGEVVKDPRYVALLKRFGLDK